MMFSTGAAAGWAVLAIACYLLSEIGEMISIPAPQLVVSLAVGAALALTGLVRRQLPTAAGRSSQAVLGALMGSYLVPSQLASAAGRALPLAVVTVATVAVCVGAAVLIARRTRTRPVDAVLGLIPGGSAAIVAYSEDLGADSRVVAFAQYLRVGLVALSAPMVVLALNGPATGGGGPGSFPDLAHPVDSSHQLAGLATLLVICAAGSRVGRGARLPAPSLLGPMLVAAVVLATGIAPGFAPAGPLQDVVWVLVGLEVGLRFTRPAVRHIGRLMPHLLGGIVLVCLACAGFAWILAAVAGVPFLEAYLATTPGGINAVLATAAATHTDVPVVAVVQSLRLFLIVLLTPPIIGWAVRRPTRHTAARIAPVQVAASSMAAESAAPTVSAKSGRGEQQGEGRGC
ncbi:AbrB family transcriptional regulator [Parafrankia discariae]|uniref:AbrB family transcriptional regulator n=1 Tax=Parafrankia discariae TaxID=365528 RepID=UPI00039B5E9D|nr:AbrB family transcriptional regulator [Parafrankia discariae]